MLEFLPRLADMSGFNLKAIAAGGASFLGLASSALAPHFAAISPDAVTTWVGALTVAVASSAGFLATTFIVIKKRFDDANKDSLSAQLTEMNANQAKMRDSLHAVRNEQAAERARHQEERLQHQDEVERLIRTQAAVQESFDRLADENKGLRKQLDAVQASLDAMSGENRGLRVEVDRLKRHIDHLSAGVERIAPGSSDSIPGTGEMDLLPE